MKLTLTQKGLLFVLAPLAIQLGFLATLAYLNAQTEQELKRAFHSGQISDATNKLVHDMFEMVSLGPGEFAKSLYSEGNENAISKAKSDLDELKLMVKGNPQQEAIVQNSIDAGEEACDLLKQLRLNLGTDNPFMEGRTLSDLRNQLRSCLKRIVSQELIDLGRSEKEKVKLSHEIQVRDGERIKLLLTTGVIFNIAFTVILTLVFGKQIVSRLKILADNSFRLASFAPLNPRLKGSDEIAYVDESFHEMAAALAEAKQKEKSLVDHSLDVICSLDHNNKFTAANPACTSVFGQSEEELLGMNLKNFLASEDIERFEKCMSEALTGRTEAKLETRIVDRAGKVSELDWSIHWVPSEERFFCVGHDISERKEVERLKQQFMAMITHDLRTPLTVLKGFLEMSSLGVCGEFNETGERLLKGAERNADRMLTLVNDLLDLEKSESGRLSINQSAIGLNDILDRCVKSLAPLALNQKVHLQSSPNNLIVFADQHRLSQVLTNLASNAIKFSPEEGIVKLWAEQKDCMAVVYVSDQGRGVPEHLKEAIFEQFRQVEVADAVVKGGTGLGLAICKVIVELHGGKIKVENLPDKGSLFSFSLPLAGNESTNLDRNETSLDPQLRS